MSSQGFIIENSKLLLKIKAKNKCFIDSECTGPVSKIVATF